MIKTLFLLILSTKLAWSEMVSLKDYHAANPYLGNDEIYYVSNRCSALMYHLFSLQQTPTDLKEFLKNSQKEFTSLSLLIKQNNDPSLSDEVYLNETSEKIDLIIDDYINSSNEHFYETGTYISPDMWGDLDLCSQILESKN
tara:strand:+ start:666 stop:1091 length:426 start_codon:yes stop_codon:yes gene_type:complete